MKTETLYTRPLELPTGHLHSVPRTITNQPHSELRVGHGSREENFGIKVPERERKFQTPDGAVFIRKVLTTEPEGQGELVTCWIRQS